MTPQHDRVKLTEALVRHEMIFARQKFPSTKHLLLAFCEEHGEVVKAFLDLKQGKCDNGAVIKELVQCLCVGFRLLEEGDEDFPEFDPPGLLPR